MENGNPRSENDLAQRRKGAKVLGDFASSREHSSFKSSILHPRSSLILTPDGPRGPRRHLAEGATFLASRLQMPIVCMGFGFDRPWRQNSWDRFAIPRPFSRARAVISRYVEIPPDLDRQGIESYRLQVEEVLNRMTQEAEAWAESGRRKAGEMPLLRNEPAPQMAA
jgi:hypothetical protein